MTVELPHFTLPFRWTPVVREPSYRDTILGDAPAAYWRLGEEAGATVAVDETGNAPGTYVGSRVGNLIPNPSFEVDLSGWTPGGAGVSMTRVTNKAYAATGTAQAYLSRTIPASPTYGECSMKRLTVNAMPCDGGVTYTLTAYIWQETSFAAQGPWVQFTWYDAGMVQISYKTINIATALGRWYRLIGTQQAPDNAAFVGVGVGLYAGSSGDGTSVVSGWVDGVQLTPTSEAVPYSDTVGIVLGRSGALPVDSDTAPAFNGGYVDTGREPGDVTRPFSRELWFNTTAAVASNVAMSHFGSNNGYFIRGPIANGAVNFSIVVDGTYSAVSSQAGLNDGKWHHLVAVWDGTNMMLYVDAVMVKQAPAPVPGYTTNSFWLASIYGNQQWYNGLLDEVAVYNYVLSPDTIARHYARGLRTVIPVIGAGISAEVAEQESVAEIASCCEAIIRTVQGERTTMPEFGRPELEFNSDPAFVRTAIAGALTEFEPRVESLVNAAPDPSDVEIQTVRALIAPRDTEEGDVT